MDSSELPKDIETKVKDALKENGLLILFRVRNNQADYSIMNRPEPTLTEVSDHLLATAIIEAVKTFEFKREKPRYENEKISRDDGRTVTYKHHIDFDWEDKIIRCSKGSDLMKQVLSIVVQNLMSSAQQQQSAKANKDGLN